MTEIRLRHGYLWLGLTIVYYGLAGGAVVIAAAAVADAGPVAAILGSLAAAALLAATATLFLAGARRAPSLRLVDDGIVLDLPGILREPLHVPRYQLRHVYIRDADDQLAELPRRAGGSRRPVRIRSQVVPVLRFGWFGPSTTWTLLLLLDPPLSFDGLIRRTTVVRSFAAGVLLRESSELPGLFTVAHGLACEPQDLAGAVNTLFGAGYPVTHLPASPAHLDWLASR